MKYAGQLASLLLARKVNLNLIDKDGKSLDAHAALFIAGLHTNKLNAKYSTEPELRAKYGDDYGVPSGSEICLGQTLGAERKKIVLATKFGNERKVYDANTKGGSSRRVIMIAVEASLKRFNTDYIDLYQAHKPDPKTPIEETMRALDDLVKQGKVRHIGC